MRVSPNNMLRAALALAGLLLVAGCSRSLVTAPDPGTTSAPTLERGSTPPPPPSLLGELLPAIDKVLNWTTIVQALVLKDRVTVVTGHRWSLQFDKGSLTDDELITIQDYDADILDVQFGPHGTKFPVPVTLSIDFRNTVADPGAAQYDGSEPVLYWLNDQTNTWEEVPGRTDWARMKHIVRLEHFSRYVVGGKAGWKHAPQREEN